MSKLNSRKLRNVAKKWQARALQAGEVAVNDVGDDAELDNETEAVDEAKRINSELDAMRERVSGAEDDLKVKEVELVKLQTKVAKLKTNAKASGTWMQTAEIRIKDLGAKIIAKEDELEREREKEKEKERLREKEVGKEGGGGGGGGGRLS